LAIVFYHVFCAYAHIISPTFSHSHGYGMIPKFLNCIVTYTLHFA